MIKDHLLSYLGRLFAQRHLKQYGTLVSLELDSVKRIIRVSIQLNGETAPVDASLIGYRIDKQDGGFRLKWDRITVSRAWMEVIANERAPRDGVVIPKMAALALK